jgi:hypothetical protein
MTSCRMADSIPLRLVGFFCAMGAIVYWNCGGCRVVVLSRFLFGGQFCYSLSSCAHGLPWPGWRRHKPMYYYSSSTRPVLLVMYFSRVSFGFSSSWLMCFSQVSLHFDPITPPHPTLPCVIALGNGSRSTGTAGSGFSPSRTASTYGTRRSWRSKGLWGFANDDRAFPTGPGTFFPSCCDLSGWLKWLTVLPTYRSIDRTIPRLISPSTPAETVLHRAFDFWKEDKLGGELLPTSPSFNICSLDKRSIYFLCWNLVCTVLRLLKQTNILLPSKNLEPPSTLSFDSPSISSISSIPNLYLFLDPVLFYLSTLSILAESFSVSPPTNT